MSNSGDQNRLKNEEFQTLIALLKHQNDLRLHADTLVWQIPSFAIAITSFVVLAYVNILSISNNVFCTIQKQCLFCLLSLFLSWFLLVSIYIHNKHRWFSDVATNDCKLIQKKLKKFHKSSSVPTIYYETKDILNSPESRYRVKKKAWYLNNNMGAFKLMNITLWGFLIISIFILVIQLAFLVVNICINKIL